MKGCLVLILVSVTALAEGPLSVPALSPVSAWGPPTTVRSPVSPVSPAAAAGPVRARTPEELAAQSGFQIGVGLTHDLGLGTFVDAKSFSLLTAGLSISAAYRFRFQGVKLSASAGLSGGWVYTLPDTETGRRWTIAPLRFGLSAPGLYKDKLTGIALAPSVSFTLPTSQESWGSGLITNFSAGLGASRQVKKFNLQLNLHGSHGFYTNPENALRPDPTTRDAYGNLLYLCRTGEVACAGGSNNTAWTLGFNTSVVWFPVDTLEVFVSYGLTKAWKYAATPTVDEFTPKALDSNGNPVARVGLGQADSETASIGVGWQVTPRYSLDLVLGSNMAPLTATGLVRFPFFAFGHLADNSTRLTLSFGGGF
jgi:hypothetical protein